MSKRTANLHRFFQKEAGSRRAAAAAHLSKMDEHRLYAEKVAAEEIRSGEMLAISFLDELEKISSAAMQGDNVYSYARRNPL